MHGNDVSTSIAARRLRIITVIVIAIAALLTVDYWGYPYGARMRGLTGNIGENGLWLQYTWYVGEHSMTVLDPTIRARRILTLPCVGCGKDWLIRIRTEAW
jgi:hypothetical protein